jgi:DNA polymerase III subunit delta'
MDWGIVGHEWAVDLLAGHVAQGRERHAYLFTGPQGVGRRTLALRLAQALNCLNPPTPGQPCLICSACKRIGQLQHPDLVVVEAEQEGGTLKVDQVRELQHTLSLAPYEARYRVALLLRFEEAHASAANALLKTLEEPAAQVVLILTAKSAESLLPTIVSRCEVLRLRPIAVDYVAQGLQTLWGLSTEEAEKLAHISGGRPGYAIRLHEHPALLEQRQAWLDELVYLLSATRRERFAVVKGAAEDKDTLRNLLQVWLSFWRDVLICAGGLTDSMTNLDYSQQIQTLAADQGLSKAQKIVSAVEHTMELIDRNVNPRLALDVLMIDFPGLKLSASA